MASAHGHLNNEVMNNNRPPAPKSRKWLMRNNKSSLSGLMCDGTICEVDAHMQVVLPATRILQCSHAYPILKGRQMHK